MCKDILLLCMSGQQVHAMSMEAKTELQSPEIGFTDSC